MQRNGGLPHYPGSEIHKLIHKNLKVSREDRKMKKVKFTFDEIRALILILTEYRNMLIEEDRNTDIIDEIMIKLL